MLFGQGSLSLVSLEILTWKAATVSYFLAGFSPDALSYAMPCGWDENSQQFARWKERRGKQAVKSDCKEDLW